MTPLIDLHWQMLESFLLDPDLMDDRTSNNSASHVSCRQPDFRKRVAARDGTCVMTSTPVLYTQAFLMQRGMRFVSIYLELFRVLISGPVHH